MDDVPADRRLYPAAIDYRAEHSPDKVFAILPNGDRLEDGFYELNYRAFAKAIDETAWWLDSVLGAESTTSKAADFPAIPYVGANDFRYVLLTLACMKSRRKVSIFVSATVPTLTSAGLHTAPCQHRGRTSQAPTFPELRHRPSKCQSRSYLA